ncbi:MAG: hypothetical protein LUD12_03220 [Lachnospiraceae bacterium]|nr:hypothetical protein [Lachnospiraceae bacterium]
MKQHLQSKSSVFSDASYDKENHFKGLSYETETNHGVQIPAHRRELSKMSGV